MSLLARAPRALLRQQATRSPLVVPSRNMSGDYHHLPFKWPGNKKGIFATKVAVYMVSGFSIPFFAAYYQLRKAAA